MRISYANLKRYPEDSCRFVRCTELGKLMYFILCLARIHCRYELVKQKEGIGIPVEGIPNVRINALSCHTNLRRKRFPNLIRFEKEAVAVTIEKHIS